MLFHTFKKLGFLFLVFTSVNLVFTTSAEAANCSIDLDQGSATYNQTYVDNNSCTALDVSGIGTLTISGTPNMSGSSTITFSSGTITLSGVMNIGDDNIVISDGALVNHAGDDTTGVQIITTGDVTIDSGGSIDVTGRGCQGGGTHNNGKAPDLDNNGTCVIKNTANTNAPGGGIGSNGAACGNCSGAGGGYGGTGGNNKGGARAGGSTYGDQELTTLYLGSAGGSHSNTNGAAGGGIISIQADTLTLNGSLLAKGVASTGRGAGSGGAIKISVTTFDGSGSLNASGTNGTTNVVNGGGGGGGGRIAVYYEGGDYNINGITASSNAAGGTARDGGFDGSDGSVYKVQYTVPGTPTVTAPTQNSFNVAQNPTITGSVYSSNGKAHTATTLRIYANANKTGLVYSGTINSGTNSFVVNTSNGSFTGALNGQTKLAAFTPYHATLQYTNGVGNSTEGAVRSFTTVFTGSVQTQTYHFNESTPSNATTFNSTYLDIASSEVSVDKIGSGSGKTFSGESGTWSWYRNVTVTNNEASSLTNYQAKVVVDFRQAMQDDFDDIRFVDSDGTTTLNFYREAYLSGKEATFWVKIPSLPANGKTIRVYYGNSAVSTKSNSGNTFDFYDGFDGNSLDTTKWNNTMNSANYSVANGVFRVTHGPNAHGKAIYSKTTLDHSNYLVETKYKWTNPRSGGGDAVTFLGLKDSNEDVTSAGIGYFVYAMYSTGTGSNNACTNNCKTRTYEKGTQRTQQNYVDANKDYIVQLEVKDTQGAIYRMSEDDGVTYTQLYDSSNHTDDSLQIALAHHSGSHEWDWVRARRKGDVTTSVAGIATQAIAFSKQPINKIGNLVFSKQKVITLTNNTNSDLVNMNVKLTVSHDSDMQADFDDLRFVDKYNQTIPYWIESKTNSSEATVWVKVEEVPSSGTTITMLYGNGSATSASNGEDTFHFYEDFTLSSIDDLDVADKWFINGTASNNWTIASNTLKVNHASEGWNKALYSLSNFTRPDTADWKWVLKDKFYWRSNRSGFDAFYPIMAKDTTGNVVGCTDCIYGIYNKGKDGESGAIDRDGWVDYENFVSVTTWYDVAIEITNTGANYKHRETGANSWTSMVASDYTGHDEFKVAILHHSGGYDVDDVILRKEADISTSFGSETASNGPLDFAVVPVSSGALDFSKIYTFAASSSGSNIYVQGGVDTDDDNTVNKWCYFDTGTSSWAEATDPHTHRNTVAEMNSYLGSFDTGCGAGDFYYRVMLIDTDAKSDPKLDSITITYAEDTNSASINDVSLAENVSNAVFTVTLTENAASELTVDYTTNNGTATAGTDFTSTSGTLTFATGENSKTISVPITNDIYDESNETFTVTLSNASEGLSINDSSGTGTITDNDSAPTLSVADVNVNENAGTATISVAMNGGSQSVVTADYSLSDGTAAAGTHYTSTSGTLTWAARNTTAKTFTVTIADNNIDNVNKNFTVNLANASNATFSDSSATVTIIDNEAQPTLSVNDVSKTEGQTATVTVTASVASESDITFSYNTANSTAQAGSDYTAISGSGTGTISAGQTTTTFDISTTDDNAAEGTETFRFNISGASNASISDNQGTITLNDNDVPYFTIADKTSAENVANAIMVVTLNGKSDSDLSVNWATSNGTAASGSDYTASNGTLTWTAGTDGGKNITIPVSNDSLDEASETVTVTLSNNTNGSSITDNQGILTITDNDASPSVSLSLSSTSSTEADEDDITITATLSTASGRDVVANLAYAGTATDDSDYSVADTITISAGQTTGTTTLSISDDSVDEGSSETIQISIDSVTDSAASVTGGSKTITVTDDDTKGIEIVEPGDATNITEGGATDTYRFRLTSQPLNSVTVTVSPDEDSTTDEETITFTTGNWNVFQTLTVTAVNDYLSEGNHTSTISHTVASDDSNYDEFSMNSITANITDNDFPGVSIAESGGSTVTREGSQTDSYTIVLTAEPFNDVTIDIDADNQLSLSATSLTFTSQNWNTAQTVTVTPVNDFSPENQHFSIIQHTATSDDADYDEIDINNVNVTINDDDSANVVIVQSANATAVEEDGDSDSFTVKLGSRPLANKPVAIALSTDSSELQISPKTLTFRNNNFNQAKTVTVTAVDDSDIEGNHNATITFTATSSTAGYNNLSIPAIVVSITDNDTVGNQQQQQQQQQNNNDDDDDENDDDEQEQGQQQQQQQGPAPTLTVEAGSGFTVENGQTVTLGEGASATCSDSSLDMAYSWRILSHSRDVTNPRQLEGATFRAPRYRSNKKKVVARLTVACGRTVETDTVAFVILPPRKADDDNLEVLTTALVEAGDGRTVEAGTSFDIKGSAECLDSSHTLTYTWTQTAGPGIDLSSSEGNLEFSLVAPDYERLNKRLTFNLKATCGGVSQTDTVSFNVVRSRRIQLPTTPGTTDNTDSDTTGTTSDDSTEQQDVNNNTQVWEEELVAPVSPNAGLDCDFITKSTDASTGETVFDVCGDFEVASPVNPNITVKSIDDYLIFSDPMWRRGTGIIYIVDIEKVATNVRINPYDDDFLNNPYVYVSQGPRQFSFWGSILNFCDIDGDGTDELMNLAPGIGHGSTFFHDITPTVVDGENNISLDVTYLIRGGAQAKFAKLIDCGDVNGTGGDEIIVGQQVDLSVPPTERKNFFEQDFSVSLLSTAVPQEDLDLLLSVSLDEYGESLTDEYISLSESEDADIEDTTASESNSALGVQSSDDEVTDFGEEDPAFAYSTSFDYDHMVVGDLNGDGVDDTVFASTDCNVVIYLGSEDVGSTETALDDADVLACDGDSLSDLAIADVTGDGIPDLVLSIADGEGEIHVIEGREDWSGADLADAIVLEGVGGGDLILADSDDSGSIEIIAGNGDDGTTQIDLEGVLGGGDGFATGGSATGAATSNGFFCSLNETAQNPQPWGWMAMAILVALGFMRARRATQQ